MGALSDPIQYLFDRSQEMAIGLMQADLKLRLGICVGLVNQITIPASSCAYQGSSVALGSKQTASLFQLREVMQYALAIYGKVGPRIHLRGARQQEFPFHWERL